MKAPYRWSRGPGQTIRTDAAPQGLHRSIGADSLRANGHECKFAGVGHSRSSATRVNRQRQAPQGPCF